MVYQASAGVRVQPHLASIVPPFTLPKPLVPSTLRLSSMYINPLSTNFYIPLSEELELVPCHNGELVPATNRLVTNWLATNRPRD